MATRASSTQTMNGKSWVLSAASSSMPFSKATPIKKNSDYDSSSANRLSSRGWRTPQTSGFSRARIHYGTRDHACSRLGQPQARRQKNQNHDSRNQHHVVSSARLIRQGVSI